MALRIEDFMFEQDRYSYMNLLYLAGPTSSVAT